MTQQRPEQTENGDPTVVIVGPDGIPRSASPGPDSTSGSTGGEGDGPDDGTDDGADDGADDGSGERHITELVEQPAKVMRIGSMIRQLLEEVKAAPLDEASRARLKEIHQSSIKELEAGLAPELVEELERLSLPFNETTPSESELRIAQAQLVGWLEGLFHGIQTAIYAQQMAARAQLEQMRRALPPGMIPDDAQMSPGAGTGQPGQPSEEQGSRGGMYL